MIRQKTTVLFPVFFLVLLIVPIVLLGISGIITNTDGRSFEGELRVLPDNTIQLVVEVGAGSASYVFRKENLAGIEFLDAETLEDGMDAYLQHQYEAAITSLESVHRGRSPFFKLLPNPQLADASLALGNAYLKMKRYTDATGVAGVLLGTDFEDPVILTKANELLLMAFFGMERWDETEVLAKRWCEIHEPFDESALGWWILSEVHLARGELEKARWVSLQPITFSSQYPKAYLKECFQVAIASWIEEMPEQAQRLYKQYQNRGYTWPDDKYPEIKLQLVAHSLTQIGSEEESQEDDPVTIEEGEPKKDLNLPLETVRKLTTKKEPSPAP
ncbi:MAG: hypothetical protein O7C75_13145 [Verrucomicrobia bacterium]|nr:hypothetical protein [Verrucomicrobiota bacterium]